MPDTTQIEKVLKTTKVIPLHTHNGTDSLRILAKDIDTSGLTEHAVLLSEGSGGTAVTGPGTSGQVLTSNGSSADPTFQDASVSFGGDGSDGALVITSGTTTIDLAFAQILVKNYTSISITGTGKLAFIAPNTNGSIIILKSQGGVTLTSSATPMIDCSALGAAGAFAVTNGGTGGASVQGINGNNGNAYDYGTAGGGKGLAAGGGSSAGAAFSGTNLAYAPFNISAEKYRKTLVGSGGGSGGSGVSSNSNTGAGGNGGGGLIIECGGAWNFTTTSGISVAGQDGGNAVATAGGGGGGGSGGSFLAIYNTLTANTGTVNVAGGSGGLNGGAISTGVGPVSGGGGGGGIVAGSAGTTSALDNVKTGGNGAPGVSVIVANI